MLAVTSPFKLANVMKYIAQIRFRKIKFTEIEILPGQAKIPEFLFVCLAS